MWNAELISSKFESIYNQNPTTVIKSPGRINLIGEHTDYNDGFVLPAAIDKAIYFALREREDRLCRFYSVDLDDYHEINLDDYAKSPKQWANYLIGVINEIQEEGHQIPTGFELAFGGDIPLGAGLSSSAAVETGMGYGLSQLFGLSVDRLTLAKVAQRAERKFAGLNCGIMDMYASLFGKRDAVIKLDCRALTHQYFDLPTKNHSIVLCNTGVKHNLSETAYNKRREECEEGVAIIQTQFPAVVSLRDISLSQLTSIESLFPPVVYRRCHFVVAEIERVGRACSALTGGRFKEFGDFMYETHEGLRDDYEVSCPELDFLVEQAKLNQDVLGSRMMGGGFGGCTINLIKNDGIEDFIASATKAYEAAFNIELKSYTVVLNNGVEEVSLVPGE
ncbi:galactokinase [Emticicia sp. CRIBPO]|uniref:galactokinase n=1 Tax=Emticicia sp. CRIBPO TaxID=2683258 RepID=UPI00141292A2|nr:galactokinase [Emticicia sp. CRIBPO]NBA88769.1 galactokinase [Emticicia sp. CRIBPO]